MSGELLADMLKSLGLLGGFLVLGVFLRAKIPALQKTFIPASVVGGFALLIFGPQVLDILPVPEDWFAFYALIPGVLIVPIVTSVPLGLRIDKGTTKGSKEAKTLRNILPLIGIGLCASMSQFAVGYGTHMAFNKSFDLYPVFGIELPIGYVGGHGTAGVLGNMLQEMNMPYWQTSQGVAVTTATIGIVGGILIGITLINWAARHGQTAILDKPADIPETFRVGYEKDPDKQPSMGRETTMSSSIDSYAFHLALLFIGCSLSYLVVKGVKAANIPVLKSISTWAYGMIIMALIWKLMLSLKIDFLVDSKVKGKISGSLTDFAVIAAVGSLPLKAVAQYIGPIIVMCLIGFAVTALIEFFACRRFLNGYWFEQMIATFGMSSGVFLTGILLLRICDPDLESPALTTYSLSYTITSIIYFALLNMFIVLPIEKGVGTVTGVAAVLAVAFFFVALISSRSTFGKEFKGNK